MTVATKCKNREK